MNFNEEKIKIKLYIEVFMFFLMTVGPFNPIYKILVYVFLFILNFRYWKSMRFVNFFQILLILSIIFPMVLDIRNVSSVSEYSKAGFAYLIPFLFCIIFAKKYKLNEFLIITERVAFFVTCISLLGYLILLLYPNFFSKFPVITFYGRKVRSIIIFNLINDYSGNYLQRNCGIAFEPGAFQFVCNLGLAIYMKLSDIEVDNKFKITSRYIIYILGVLSTKSTTGIFILIIITTLTVITSKKKKINSFFILSSLILLYEFINSSIIYQKEKLETGNLELRFRNTLFVIKNYWWRIFGIGSTGYDKIYIKNNMIGSFDAYSNIYLRFGLLFTFIFILLNFKLLKIDKNIFIVIAVTLLTENLIGPITVILYYMTLKEEDFNNESNVGMQSTK